MAGGLKELPINKSGQTHWGSKKLTEGITYTSSRADTISIIVAGLGPSVSAGSDIEGGT